MHTLRKMPINYRNINSDEITYRDVLCELI